MERKRKREESEKVKMVNDNITLHPDFVQVQLTWEQQRQIEQEGQQNLRRIDPMLACIAKVEVKTNQRRNFINIRVRNDYTTLLFYYKGANGGGRSMEDESTTKAEIPVFYCFFMSDKLEPFIIITVVDQFGKLGRITKPQAEDLKQALQLFKGKYGISGETYHYTPLQERKETDQFSSQGGCFPKNRSHSSHFHLKMRVSTEMYKDRMPVLQLINFNLVRTKAEPVQYNYSRETKSYEDMLIEIHKDVVD